MCNQGKKVRGRPDSDPAPASHIRKTFPVDTGNITCYDKVAGRKVGQPTGKEREPCTNAVDQLLPLTKEEREWILMIANTQHRKYSDVTYLLAYLDECLELSEYSEPFSALPGNGHETK